MRRGTSTHLTLLGAGQDWQAYDWRARLAGQIWLHHKGRGESPFHVAHSKRCDQRPDVPQSMRTKPSQRYLKFEVASFQRSVETRIRPARHPAFGRRTLENRAEASAKTAGGQA